MQKDRSRLPLIDALKAIASQFIVLHHLAYYGPISEAARDSLPGLFSWLANDARIAVQVFLVIGGFLAAQSLAPSGILKPPNPLQLIKKRYLKLVTPFLAAVLFCILASAIARTWLIDEAIPDRPTLWQFLAHAALLHGVLGFDSLSAGVWYIAIDFQLFVVLLIALWLARSTSLAAAKWIGIGLVVLVSLASLFHFNRNADWDNWAIYFFGAYGIGALTFWLSEQRTHVAGQTFIALATAAALAVDFRSRILVALVAALILGFSRRTQILETWPNSRVLGWLGKISYSVFLIHFPLILLANALFAQMHVTSPWAGLSMAAGTWLISVLSGAVFYHQIESRSAYWQSLLLDPVLQLPLRLFALQRPR